MTVQSPVKIACRSMARSPVAGPLDGAGGGGAASSFPAASLLTQALMVAIAPTESGVVADENDVGATSDASLVGAHCLTLDGSDDYIAVASLTGSETVVSSGGTSTPSISAGRIDFTAGTCWDLVLSNGNHYPLAEGGGNIAYDVINAANGTLTNANLTTAWAASQDSYHFNVTSGFSYRQNILHNSASTTGWTLNLCTLALVADPEGGTRALRMIPNSTASTIHRAYTSSISGWTNGDYLVVYAKPYGATIDYFGFLPTSGSNGYYKFSDGSHGGTATFISATDVGGGWTKLVWQIPTVGTLLQIFPATTSTFAPANTTDGIDYYIAAVTDPTAEPFPTTGTYKPYAAKIPAASSSVDAAGFALLNPAGVGHNFAESEIDGVGALGAPWHPSDGLTNPNFFRLTTDATRSVLVDRVLTYSEVLTGQDLSDVQTYVTTVAN